MKKNIFLVMFIFIFLVSLSFNFVSADLNSKDFGEFSMDVPSGIDFHEDTLNEKHVFNSKQMVVGIYDKKLDDVNYVYDFFLKDATIIYPDTVSYNDFSSQMTFYKEKESNFLDDYATTYENEDMIIFISYDDLDELVNMTRTIEIS